MSRRGHVSSSGTNDFVRIEFFDLNGVTMTEWVQRQPANRHYELWVNEPRMSHQDHAPG